MYFKTVKRYELGQLSVLKAIWKSILYMLKVMYNDVGRETSKSAVGHIAPSNIADFASVLIIFSEKSVWNLWIDHKMVVSLDNSFNLMVLDDSFSHSIEQ